MVTAEKCNHKNPYKGERCSSDPHHKDAHSSNNGATWYEWREKLEYAVCPSCGANLGGYLNRAGQARAVEYHLASAAGSKCAKPKPKPKPKPKRKSKAEQLWRGRCAACGFIATGKTKSAIRVALSKHITNSDNLLCLDKMMEAKVEKQREVPDNS